MKPKKLPSKRPEIEDQLNVLQKGRIITIFDEWFKGFLDDERAIAGNKLFTFSSKAKRIFLKNILCDDLSDSELEYMKNYGVKKW